MIYTLFFEIILNLKNIFLFSNISEGIPVTQDFHWCPLAVKRCHFMTVHQMSEASYLKFIITLDVMIYTLFLEMPKHFFLFK